MKAPAQPQSPPEPGIDEETIHRRRRQSSTSISSEGEQLSGLAEEAEGAELAVIFGKGEAKFITIDNHGEIVDKFRNDFEDEELTLHLRRGEKGLMGRVTKVSPQEDPGREHPPSVDQSSAAPRSSMPQNASQSNHQSFRNFVGLSALTSLAFIALFGTLYNQGLISLSSMAITGVLLALSAMGFSRLWYDLRA